MRICKLQLAQPRCSWAATLSYIFLRSVLLYTNHYFVSAFPLERQVRNNEREFGVLRMIEKAQSPV